MYHIGQHIKLKFENDALGSLFFKSAEVYRASEFNDFMDQIGSVEPDAAQYLEEVGYAKLARSHFPSKRFTLRH